MIRCMLLSADGHLVRGGKELLERWTPQTRQKCWLDIYGDTDEEEQLLLDLNCHPLAVQDALRKRHPPKIEFFEEQVFILYQGLVKVEEGLLMDRTQIALFASDNLLITRHDRSSFAVDHWWNNESVTELLPAPLLLATRIVRYSFGLYLKALLDFEHDLAENEDAMQSSPDDDLMRELIQHKARLRRLLRTFNYHAKLTTELLEYVQNAEEDESQGSIIHDVQDLHERTDRISSLLGMYYEICGDLIEGYISITSHSLNKTMQILTVVTTLFVPLGFLAGLYGMNFENMPELGYRYAYFVLLGIMLVIATSALIIFRRKRWI